jgi:carbonic anhydrase/acetyltransferase-like protein (isoleucine patch superfamily)
MSARPGSALSAPQTDSLRIAESAVVLGTAYVGEGALIDQGAVIRASGTGVEVGAGSAVFENSVVVGTPRIETTIGRRTTQGGRRQAHPRAFPAGLGATT